MLLMRELTLELLRVLLEVEEGADLTEWFDLREDFLLMFRDDLPEPSPLRIEEVVEGSFSLAVSGLAEGILEPSPPWIACLFSKLSSNRNIGQKSEIGFPSVEIFPILLFLSWNKI